MSSGVVIVAVTSQHCPACAEYKPRFTRISQAYAGRVPAHIIDVEAAGGNEFADRYMVNALPTTLILRRPVGAIRAEGSLPDNEIQRMFEFAASYR